MRTKDSFSSRVHRIAVFAGSALALGATCSLAACGASPASVDQPVASASATAVTVAAPTYDLSPVAAPPRVIFQLHAKSLDATVGALGGTKASQEALTRNLFHELLGKRGLRIDVDADKLTSLVALDTPIDFVAALPEDGPEPVMAFAMGLKSLDDAKTAFNVTTEVTPGMWVFGGERAKAFCVVAASSGASPARAICGQGERDVRALGPWLARGATLIQATADATIDIDIKPIDTKFGVDLRKLLKQAPGYARSFVGLGQAQFDKAVEEGAAGLAAEASALLGDTDNVHLDVSLSPDTGIKVDATATFKGKSSWFVQTASKTENVSLPALFSRAPADSDSITYSRLRDPADYDGIKRVLKEAVEGALAKFNLGSDVERKKVSALLDLPLMKDLDFVSVSGHTRVTKTTPAVTKQEKLNVFLDSQTGWRLFGTNQKAAVITKWLRDSVNAYNLPGVQKEITAQQKAGAPLPSVKTPPPPAKLGKGAFEADIAMKVEGSTTRDPVSITFYVLVMDDGDSSWVGFSTNRDELVERLVMVRASETKCPLGDGLCASKAIGGRSGLGALTTIKGSTAGFFTLASFESIIQTLVLRSGVGSKAPEEDMIKAVAQTDQLIANLPNHATTPIIFEGDVRRADPLVSHFSLVVAPGTVQDIGAFIGLVARPGDAAPPPPPSR